jgi:hypothetical protein
MDVSITKICLDISILAKSIMDRRKYNRYTLQQSHTYEKVHPFGYNKAIIVLLLYSGLGKASTRNRKRGEVTQACVLCAVCVR